MASEILGLFTTPEDYQMRQQQAQQNRALQFAQLDPFERASYGIYKGAGQLAGATAGLFGMQDPQLRMISQRQALSQEIDPSDPESIMRAARKAVQLNDQQFAFGLVDAARKMQSEMALAQQRKAAAERETKQAIPAGIAEASAKGELDLTIDRLSKMDPTPEVMGALNKAKILRAAYDKEAGTTPEMKNADAFALRKGPRGSPEYNAEFDTKIKEFTSRPEKITAYGADRNATAQGLYEKDFADLTKEQKQKVNDIVEQEKKTIAEAGAAKPPVLGTGKLGAKEITDFRKSGQETVKPQLEAITSADVALKALEESIKNKNPKAFDLARRSLLKASGETQISNTDIQGAGGDPSLLGGAVDVISVAFGSTPSISTQNDLRRTIKVIRDLALKKGRDELDVQKTLAKRAGFTQEDVDLIYDIPAFRSKGGSEAKRTNETIPPAVESRITQVAPPAAAPKAPAAKPPAKGQKQTRTLKSGKTVTVETE